MRNPSSPSPSASAKATNKSRSKINNIGGSSTGTGTPCCSKVGLKRGPWTPEEDEVLAEYIRKEGEGRWRTLPKKAGLLRCGKSCRLRWMNYLRPSVKRGQIAPDEEDLILRLHRLLGNRWSLIAGRIPGRTDNEIKNYWNTHLSKKLISQGIDPRTHKPLNPPSVPSSSIATNPPSNRSSKHVPIVANGNHEAPSININHHLIHNHPIPNPHDHVIVNHLDQYQRAQASGNVMDGNGSDDLDLAGAYTDDVPAMGLMKSSDHLLTVNNEDYDDVNYSADDVFSSFFNSLINEDAFASQHHLQSEPPNGHNFAMPSEDHDPLISITTTASASPVYGLGVAWEPPPLLSATFNQSNPNTKKVDDQHE